MSCRRDQPPAVLEAQDQQPEGGRERAERAEEQADHVLALPDRQQAEKDLRKAGQQEDGNEQADTGSGDRTDELHAE
jgi:hypothetical protein